mmetsp:Transcript_23288/g.48428  ORF Transcript_23288/g.48428 Transcript_23288/m.48428 type:complete len:96 (-) Transcript_23288:618-905(-)
MSGIAVVDEDGMLVGNTSARDIKFAALDEGRTAMDTDILSYLASVRQATPQKKERYPSCHVHEDSTVSLLYWFFMFVFMFMFGCTQYVLSVCGKY